MSFSSFVSFSFRSVLTAGSTEHSTCLSKSDEADAVGQAQGDHVALLHPVGHQPAGDEVGAAVELGVAKGGVAAGDGEGLVADRAGILWVG